MVICTCNQCLWFCMCCHDDGLWN